MKKRDISAEHKAKFRNVLESINTFLPLNWQEIDRLLMEKWPKRENSVMKLAVTGQTRDAHMPFQPVISLTSPPNHLSKKVPLMEFKIMDADRSISGVGYKFPISLSVFDSGAQVLIIYGLRLNSSGMGSFFEDGTLRSDVTDVFHPRKVRELMEKLIASFELPEDATSSQGCRERALSEIRETLR